MSTSLDGPERLTATLTEELDLLPCKVVPKVKAYLETCAGPADVKHLLGRALGDLTEEPERAKLLATACLDRTHDAIYATSYRHVGMETLALYTASAITLALAMVRLALPLSDTSHDVLAEVIGILDKALIMTGHQGMWDEEVQGMIEDITRVLRQSRSGSDLAPYLPRTLVPDEVVPTSPKVIHPIRRLDLPSIHVFREIAIAMDAPVIITGAMEDWPAMALWKDPQYWLEIGGYRHVPVEVGGRYTDAQWGQKLMPFSTFLLEHLLRPEGPTLYLAQHDLGMQIPRLSRDLPTPDYCACGVGQAEKVMRNVWLGPAGTVSPLHHDPWHNLFAQVVGYKYIRIYAPDAAVYPFMEGDMLGNTSQVDVEAPDLELFPDIASAPYHDVRIGPGELLYIPPGWWHYVRSLTVSASVSFWF